MKSILEIKGVKQLSNKAKSQINGGDNPCPDDCIVGFVAADIPGITWGWFCSCDGDPDVK